MLYLKVTNYEDIEKEFLFVRDMPIDENGMTNDGMVFPVKNLRRKL